MRSTDQNIVPLPEHLSFSQFKSLAQCGEKYLLEKGYGKKGDPWWAGVGGTAVHSLTDTWDRYVAFQHEDEFDLYAAWATEFENAILTEEERSERDRSQFASSGRKSAKYPDKEGYDFWMENGPIFVNNWIGWRHSSPWDIALNGGGEICSEVGVEPVIGGVPSKGSIDRVMIAPNGDLIILDLKSGGREEMGYLQLGTYAVGLRNAWQLPDDQKLYGCFWYARKNEISTPIDLAFMTNDYMDQLYWRADQIRKQGLFLPVVDMHCSYCKVQENCSAFGGKRPETGGN